MPETLYGPMSPGRGSGPIPQPPSPGSDRSHADAPDDTMGVDARPVPPPPQREWSVKPAMLQAEYVSGGGYIFLANYLRSLPQWIDDVSRDLGEDLYDRMMLDAQVNSAIRLLKLSTLSEGVRLEPAVESDPDEAGPSSDTERVTVDNQTRDRVGRYRTRTDDELLNDAQTEASEQKKERARVEAALAAEITDFCQDALDNLAGRSFIDVLFELLDGLAYGHKVAEQVYEIGRDADGRLRVYLKALKVKPRNATAFVVDAYHNVVGLTAIMPGRGYPVTAGTVIGSPDKMPNLLPREKFAVFTWCPHNSDPRGTSLLRPVYNAWWMKMQCLGEWAKYLAQFASPSLVGITPDNAVPQPTTDALGNVIPGAPMVTPEQAMLQALMGFKNSSVLALPYGSQVTPINVGGDGQAFHTAITKFNGEISKGILCQTLATEEGVHQARAASETHQDVLDLVVLHVKQSLAQMIRRDILRPLVRYNWGETAARRLTPDVILAESAQHNWVKDASAIGSLVSSKFLDPSQYPEMDARLGLPRRKPAPVQPDGGMGGMGGLPPELAAMLGGGGPGGPGPGRPPMMPQSIP